MKFIWLFIAIICLQLCSTTTSLHWILNSLPSLFPFDKSSKSSLNKLEIPKLDLYEVNGEIYIRRSHHNEINYLKFSTRTSTNSLCITQPNSIPTISLSNHLVSAEGIFGIYKLEQGYYLAVIKSSSPVLHLSGINGIREITEIRFIHITPSISSSSSASSVSDNKILRLLLEAVRRHTFYYSATDYDFTKSVQSNHIRKANAILSTITSSSTTTTTTTSNSDTTTTTTSNSDTTTSSSSSTTSSWRDADDRFFWNLNVLKELISQGVDDVWIVPVVNCWICSDVVYKSNSSIPINSSLTTNNNNNNNNHHHNNNRNPASNNKDNIAKKKIRKNI